MPDVGTPQATWQDAPEVRKARDGFAVLLPEVSHAMSVAVAADRRIQAVRLRAKIEALREMDIGHAPSDIPWREAIDAVLAVLDAVLGGDS